jgi:hypothetical protein
LNRIVKPVSLDRQFDQVIRRFREHKSNVESEVRHCQILEAAKYREIEKRDRELKERNEKGLVLTTATQEFRDHPRSSECHRLPQKRSLQVPKASYPFPSRLQLIGVLHIGTSKKHTDQPGEHAVILSSVPRAEELQETYRYWTTRVMGIHNEAS